MRDSDWKILEVLYEKRSITQTAELLYMTQPSVTKRIKAMEEEWQIEIVKRSNRGVIFTEEGRYLVQKSYIIQDFMKEIKTILHINTSQKNYYALVFQTPLQNYICHLS